MDCRARPKAVLLAVLIFTFLGAEYRGIASAQSPGLDDLALRRGIRFGFEISPENLAESTSLFQSVVAHEAGIGTMTHYWHLPGSEQADIDITPYTPGQSSKITVGKYDFARPLSVARFCATNNIEIHGAPLLWAQDRFTPPWVLENPSKAKIILENHVKKVVGDLGKQIASLGTRVHVYQVVNEAFDYHGQLIDSYWKANLGLVRPNSSVPLFVETAFRAAAKSDPRAKLIYNDYGQEELNSAKFDAIMRMLREMISHRIPIHGMGWQLHVTANQVLRPDFPMEQRMNAVAALGLDNYITELDVVMDDRNLDGSLPPSPENGYTADDFHRQKLAYKKITEIFARVPRRRSMQVWGVYDPQSWLGADRQPLLFDGQFSKKPAYDGVREALLGNIAGLRKICHALTQGCLQVSTTGEENNETVYIEYPHRFKASRNASPESAEDSPLPWLIEDVHADGSFRVRSTAIGKYLSATNEARIRSIVTLDDSEDAEHQRWFITPCGSNYFLILNAQSGLFLSPRLARHDAAAGLSSSWLLGLWRIE